MYTAFVNWWRRPLRTRDRVGAVFIGMIGGFWVAVLGRGLFGPMPVSFTVLGYWALGGIIIGASCGIAFPRLTTVILYPFATTGISS